MASLSPRVNLARLFTLGSLGASLLAGCGAGSADRPGAAQTSDDALSGRLSFDTDQDGFGRLATYTPSGTFNTSNAFFKPLGTNGRSCSSCHVRSSGMSVSTEYIQDRFFSTWGDDPLFRPVDGANNPNDPDATSSSLYRLSRAYSMLLEHGTIRVGIGVPAGADFFIPAGGISDPYHFASSKELSLFRRPLPSTNLKFLATVMWDGRETVSPTDIVGDLQHQANDATLGHAQATHELTAAQKQSIQSFESGLFTAQDSDDNAGYVRAENANGGAVYLSQQPFQLFMNDPLQGPFNPDVFNIFDVWADSPDEARQAVYRGQQIFNERQFVIDDVPGLTEKVGAHFTATCTVCHNTPNVGDHSSTLPVNIGLTSAHLDQLIPGFAQSDYPVYTLCKISDPNECTQTTDPGRALISGKYADIGKFKGPILRGLSSRAPYFHNGAAATLDDVVTFYDNRFAIGLSAQERSDLVAFLRAL